MALFMKKNNMFVYVYIPGLGDYIISKASIEYLNYVMPVILHQICFIILLFKIRSRLWKRHIKPFRWS